MSSTHEASGTVAALLQCLEAEYGALLAADLEQLAWAISRKEQLLAQLASQTAALSAPQVDGRRELARCRQALARAQHLNQRNALVLVPRFSANRARLRFLQSAVDRDPVYGADGSIGLGRIRVGSAQSA